jgi:HemY protein
MIRVILFLILIGLVAFGAAWLADRPGDVTITWFGYRIETSVMVLVASVAVLIVICSKKQYYTYQP